ncbi:MAG TPA: ferredoxin reductase [Thermoleophilaceae bacterium]|nr:ferredoxin reductase [Thermoleophilaceae bacterium]
MEGTAVLGGLAARAPLPWREATIRAVRSETPRAKTLVLDVPGWPGHAAGQHVDIRLTAEDGYQAQRSYSIASAPGSPDLELTVERLEDGEVSPYLTEDALPGDGFELRGPIGGYFVWDPARHEPLLLVGGGSGLVPLMAMLRQRRDTAATVDARLLLSARTLEDVLYRDELDELAMDGAVAESTAGRGQGHPVDVRITLTRGDPPPGWEGFARRIDREMLADLGPPASERPLVYVCGPTPFVEEAARLLVELGHEPARVHTERFGPTGG